MSSYYLKECVCKLSRFSHVHRFSTLWTVARQAPLSMGFSRQEYCSGLLSPPPGELPDPRVKPAFPVSLALQVDSLSLSHRWKALGIWVKFWVLALVATFYIVFSFECHNDPPEFYPAFWALLILHYDIPIWLPWKGRQVGQTCLKPRSHGKWWRREAPQALTLAQDSLSCAATAAHRQPRQRRSKNGNDRQKICSSGCQNKLQNIYF